MDPDRNPIHHQLTPLLLDIAFNSSYYYTASSPIHCLRHRLFMSQLQTNQINILMASLLLLLVLLCCFVNGVHGSAVGGMAHEELLGLFEVVGSLLEDPSWAQLHPHPCTDTPWPGIQCEMMQSQGDPFLHVTKLHIGPDVAAPPCKPTAKLSDSILKLPYLKSLSLFNCFVHPNVISLPPSLFSNASSSFSSSLEQLVIKSNTGLAGSIPHSIVNLGSLRVLSLSQNNLNGSIPKELGKLRTLEQMDLSYNHLSGQVPGEVGELTSLTILDLSWNELEGPVPSSLGQLQSLQKVDLSSNELTGKIPSDIGQLKRLILLDLSHNLLRGPIPETLAGLEDLEYFLTEDNPIGTSMPLFFGALKKLSVLGLSGCGLLGSVPSYFGSLLSLTALYLDRNRLNGTIPPGLDALPNLGQLNLSQNQLSGEIVLSEEFVGKLGERLDVRDNKGLCRNPKQRSSPYLQAPSCLNSLAKDRERPAEPGVSNSDMNGSSSGDDAKGGSGVQIGVLRSMLLFPLAISPLALCM